MNTKIVEDNYWQLLEQSESSEIEAIINRYVYKFRYYSTADFDKTYFDIKNFIHQELTAMQQKYKSEIAQMVETNVYFEKDRNSLFDEAFKKIIPELKEEIAELKAKLAEDEKALELACSVIQALYAWYARFTQYIKMIASRKQQRPLQIISKPKQRRLGNERKNKIWDC